MKLVVLTGAGVSAESGLKTFRDAGGLWEGHDVMEVASLDGWKQNPELVLNFYNQRRAAARKAQPNDGHIQLAELEKYLDITIITQNVDDLHEKAGSSHVIHLHGSLGEIKSSIDDTLIFPFQQDLKLGDLCPKGSQLRPNIVWFGEMVPKMEEAISLATQADLFAVVGTSLVVYPAAGLLQYTRSGIPMFFIDPQLPELSFEPHHTTIQESAATGVAKMATLIKKDILKN